MVFLMIVEDRDPRSLGPVELVFFKVQKIKYLFPIIDWEPMVLPQVWMPLNPGTMIFQFVL
jgi:hypothetical protein